MRSHEEVSVKHSPECNEHEHGGIFTVVLFSPSPQDSFGGKLKVGRLTLLLSVFGIHRKHSLNPVGA